MVESGDQSYVISFGGSKEVLLILGGAKVNIMGNEMTEQVGDRGSGCPFTRRVLPIGSNPCRKVLSQLLRNSSMTEDSVIKDIIR